MSDSPAVQAGRLRARSAALGPALAWLRRHAVPVTLVVLALAAATAVGPGIRATGTPAEVGTLELGTAVAPDGAKAVGAVTEDASGYVVGAKGSGRVTVPLDLPSRAGERTLLRLWVYGSAQAHSSVVLVSGDGGRRVLEFPSVVGQAAQYLGQTFDVTAQAQRPDARLEVSVTNRQTAPTFFLDRVAPVLAPDTAVASAATWSVALLVALLAAALLAVAGRLRRHWPLPLALAGVAALVWSDVHAASFETLALGPVTTWNAAVAGSWFGFHDGPLWGSWIGSSSLAVQVFHALTPIVGDAPISARSASLLALLLALSAIYALGHRVAGRVGAVTAIAVGVAAEPLRDAALSGDALPVLVLAAVLFAYALHVCAAETTPQTAALLGGAIVLLALAEPLWLPGAVLALPVVVFVRARPETRLRTLGAGALVVLVLLAGHLASSAAQHDGNALADVGARAVAARNLEFAGLGHGAPSVLEAARDPLGGHAVTLTGYVLGDHSISQVVGGALAGGQESLSAFSRGSALAVIAFAVALLGVLYTLCLPRLRLLVLVPLLVALPALFVAGRTTFDALSAGAVVWPALPAGAAVLAYAASRLVARRPAEEPEP